MKKILLVKMTSMGDLVHALPAITDACRALGEIEFDWVADEIFAQVATWHPAVRNVITTAHRRWRKNIRQTICSGELKSFYRKLRATDYDVIIDGQGNFKSAIVTRLAKGQRCGLNKACAAEGIAHLAYQDKFDIPKDQHAITRLRQLFANSLGYAMPLSDPDFGIEPRSFIRPDIDLPEKFMVFVHNASWENKLWPEPYWADLIKLVTQAGYHVILPCGNQTEYERSQRLAAISDKAVALPRMQLSEVAYIINHARAAVCVDTGLSHMCAALDVPAICLYGATDSGLIGAKGKDQVYLQADFTCAPCYLRHCNYQGKSEVTPACFAKLPPQLVWQSLRPLLKDC